MSTKNPFKNERISQFKSAGILFAHVLILMYYMPYFILGENSSLLIHDNLDSTISWVKIILDDNLFFSSPSTIVDRVLNGIPFSSLYPSYTFSTLIFKSLGIFHGYVVNKLIVSLIGFWGFYLLMRSHFLCLSSNTSRHICIGTSLIFSLLPFWSFDAHVSVLPFIFFALMNLRNNINKPYNFIILIFSAFYSSLILSGMFALFVLSSVFLRDVIKYKRVNWLFLSGIICLTLAYVASHFPLIYSFVFGDFESHRLEFHKDFIGLKSALFRSGKLLLFGQYHAHSLQVLIVLPIMILSLLGYRRHGQKVKLLIAYIVLSSLLYGFRNYEILSPLFQRIASYVPIHIDRFFFLNPMFWYVLFAVLLSWFANKFRPRKWVVYGVIIIQFMFVVRSHEMWVNRKNPSFQDFYDTELFESVKLIIDKPIDTYRIVSIGLHPAVTHYNGFSTLDGYITSYPLSYKHEFREVIKDELNRDSSIKDYYDNWGSRCYVFSSEIGTNFLGNGLESIDKLYLDYEKLYDLGCNYILSAARINDDENLKIELVGNVNSSKGFMNVYIYRLV